MTKRIAGKGHGREMGAQPQIMHEPKLYAAEGPVTGHEGKYTVAAVGCTCGWNSDGKSYNKVGDWHAHVVPQPVQPPPASAPVVNRPELRHPPVAINCRCDGDKVCALIGTNLQEGCAGFGDNLPEALRDLADALYAEVGQLPASAGEQTIREALELMVKELNWYAGKYGLGPARLQYALSQGECALRSASPVAQHKLMEEIAGWQLQERKQSLDESNHSDVRWLASGKDIAYSRVLEKLAGASPVASPIESILQFVCTQTYDKPARGATFEDGWEAATHGIVEYLRTAGASPVAQLTEIQLHDGELGKLLAKIHNRFNEREPFNGAWDTQRIVVAEVIRAELGASPVAEEEK